MYFKKEFAHLDSSRKITNEVKFLAQVTSKIKTFARDLKIKLEKIGKNFEDLWFLECWNLQSFEKLGTSFAIFQETSSVGSSIFIIYSRVFVKFWLRLYPYIEDNNIHVLFTLIYTRLPNIIRDCHDVVYLSLCLETSSYNMIKYTSERFFVKISLFLILKKIVFFFIHTFKKVRKNWKIQEKKLKNPRARRSGLEIFLF